MPDIRTALRLDALASGALGVLLVAFAGSWVAPLGLPTDLSEVVGFGLLAWTGFLAWTATTTSTRLVVEVVVVNIVWIIASAALAFNGWVELTGLGVAFVLAQAAAVAGLTALHVLALRRPRATAAVSNV